MAIIDERGRIAGRVNIIDVLVVAAALIVLPAAIGAYLLFRNPPAKLTAINPARLYEGNKVKVEVTGRDLRPFMRVSFNDVQGDSFLIATPRSALVDLPPLGPGVYDVVLYDYRQEVDRLPKAFTIMPAPSPSTIELEVEGEFIGLTPDQARGLTAGMTLPPSGSRVADIVNVGAPRPGRVDLRIGDTVLTSPTRQVDVPATVRARCTVNGNPDGTLGCVSVGTAEPVALAPSNAVLFPGGQGWLKYQVRAVHPQATEPTVADARVRFVGEPELIGLLKAGDVDGGAYAASAARHATLTRVGDVRPLAPGAQTGTSAVIASRMVDASVRIPVDRAGAEWRYMNRVVKVGAPFAFETATYVVRGEIVSLVTPPPESSPR